MESWTAPSRPVFYQTTLLVAAVFLAGCAQEKASRPPESTYAPSESCRSCHAAIFENYRQVAMARSFSRPGVGKTIEDYTRNNHFYHVPSERHYRMVEREGRFFQRRYQLDARGGEINVLEQEITYVIGSGNHARSYLHRSSSGELTQLPITWYPQENRWAMSPGYDKAKHQDFSRQIDYGCMFCHNGVTALPPGADRYGAEARFPEPLPQGIDCQRCHGPGARHIDLASNGRGTVEAVRSSMVNPARLRPELQMDICQQCHLETTSAKLPQAVRRFNRPTYSFRPGEHLSDYLIHFDHPSGTGHDDKFEIVSAAYRLRKSACFLKSAGRLTCTTCHNPHHTPIGEDAIAQFRKACLTCHAKASARHPDLATGNCATCHMPKRRTEDVVHVVMTDHLIQRRKPDGDAVAPLQEKDPSYHGGVALYDPAQLPEPDRDLYLGIALVTNGADRPAGIVLLERGIAAAGKAAPIEAYIELAGAYAAEKNPGAAVENYRKALEIDPRLPTIRYDLGRTLARLGDNQAAREQYERAIRDDSGLPDAHNNLGTLLFLAGDSARAAQEYQSAIRARPIHAEAHNNLGNLYAEQGRLQEAQAEIEEAMRSDPGFAPASNSLGIILARQGRMDLAIQHFNRAVKLDPDSAEAHHNLGRAWQSQGRREAAIAEFRRVIELDPSFATGRVSLGAALGESGNFDEAIAQFREALRLHPGDPGAERGLALALKIKSRSGR